MDQGWDNDDYLNALGGGQNSLDNVNAKYAQESDKRAVMRESRLRSMAGNGEGMDDETVSALFGAEVSGADKPPPIREHDEENPMGGQMFSKMMEKAKAGAGVPPLAMQPPAVPPPQYQQPPAAPAAVPAQPSTDAMAYYQQQVQAWQALVTAYTQLCATDPQAAARMGAPAPPPPPPQMQQPAVAAVPPPVAAAPQADPAEPINPAEYIPKSGNKDAYEITNPSDVYLAQLKRDSYVRTNARKEGDLETANNPFADVGVQAIGSILSEELLETRREMVRKNGGEFETSRDEMILPLEEEEDLGDKSYTGVSYKQKLEEMKRKRQMKE